MTGSNDNPAWPAPHEFVPARDFLPDQDVATAVTLAGDGSAIRWQAVDLRPSRLGTLALSTTASPGKIRRAETGLGGWDERLLCRLDGRGLWLVGEHGGGNYIGMQSIDVRQCEVVWARPLPAAVSAPPAMSSAWLRPTWAQPGEWIEVSGDVIRSHGGNATQPGRVWWRRDPRPSGVGFGRATEPARWPGGPIAQERTRSAVWVVFGEPRGERTLARLSMAGEPPEDPVDAAPIAPVPTGGNPIALRASADGRYLFVLGHPDPPRAHAPPPKARFVEVFTDAGEPIAQPIEVLDGAAWFAW